MARYSLYGPWGAGTRSGDFDDLRREMDALFNRFGAGEPAASAAGGVFPAVNCFETNDSYVLTAELPGVAREDIEVSIEGATVTLRGERRIDYAKDERTNLHRRERQSGRFGRAFELPSAIDTDKVEAVHRNGVLMLRLPKPHEQRPRQISVSGE